MWQPSPFLPVAFLSVVPAPNKWIMGAIAQVPDANWSALDERERAYVRKPVPTSDVDHDHPQAEVQIYAVETPVAPNPDQPILLSYIDVVAQGFLREHGEEGIDDFFQTTTGWEVPVKNDRANPQYPRHQTLTESETALVDKYLERLATVVD